MAVRKNLSTKGSSQFNFITLGKIQNLMERNARPFKPNMISLGSISSEERILM
jgi:hypothetical protein